MDDDLRTLALGSVRKGNHARRLLPMGFAALYVLLSVHVAEAAPLATSNRAVRLGEQSSPIYVRVLSPQQPASEAAKGRLDLQRQARNESWMVRLTGILALLGVAQVVVTAITLRGLRHARIAANAAERAADAAMRSADIAADTSKKQLRAYVRKSSAQIEELVVGLSPRVTVEFDNVGSTPAHEVVSWLGVNVTIAPTEPDLSPPKDRDSFSRGSLAPRESKSVSMTLPIWTAENETAFREGRVSIFAYGEVTYRDIFGEEWSTCFRLLHDRTRRTGHFGTCSQGNFST